MEQLENKIIGLLDKPSELEELYRSNKSSFKTAFNKLYEEHKSLAIVEVWNERLNYSRPRNKEEQQKNILLVIICSIIGGLLAKLPDIADIDPEFYYPRNIGFIAFAGLSIYFLWKNKATKLNILITLLAHSIALVYMNNLNLAANDDVLTLSCIHIILFLWSVTGFAFMNGYKVNYELRLNYLKYNGDLVVISALMGIAGGILSGITIGLFSLIGLQIENFYFQNIAIWGIAAMPIIGTYLVQQNPTLVGKVSPIIAKIFSPLVLLMLVVYLIAIFYNGKDPYNDREFLMIFNGLLIGVMALIFFSIADNNTKNKLELWILFLLSIVTLVVCGIALSAILFRISEWGITPNRTAVFVSNILMFAHLFLLAVQLSRLIRNRAELSILRKSIAIYLPIYIIWTMVVSFLFPLLF
jgi:hypothetical protein